MLLTFVSGGCSNKLPLTQRSDTARTITLEFQMGQKCEVGRQGWFLPEAPETSCPLPFPASGGACVLG